jgi:gamma-glutamyltranspeptidase/glutathione hydrolase
MAATMMVTLPSRAGLGGGAVCLIHFPDKRSPNKGEPEAALFAAPPSPLGGERPGAAPAMARGLFLMQSRYGREPFEAHLARAEQLARFGAPLSQALARDLAVVGGALLTDPGARAAFAPDGAPPRAGDALRQPELAATLGALRTQGVGDLYQGTLGRRFEEGSARIGAPVGQAQLRATAPRLAPPLVVAAGSDNAAFPPTEAGAAAAAAFKALRTAPQDTRAAEARALAAAAVVRAGAAPQAAIDAPGGAGTPPALPASTGYAALDAAGNAVVCAASMNNLFGTGRFVPGMGFAPAAQSQPLLASALAWNAATGAFRAMASGAGQSGAPLAAARTLADALRARVPMAAPPDEPGRANAIACARYLPSESGSCAWARDPREAGAAWGGL